MENLKIKSNPDVELVFNNYPDFVRDKMLNLRNLIIETAKEINDITTLEETLKWGEPSYVTPIGSTLRIDWKSKTPNQYAIYFQCTSRLAGTFKMIFKNTFTFEGKRAIIFQIEDKIPEEELTFCIKAALTYHKVKHQPTLGI
jgi:hypothetical protein